MQSIYDLCKSMGRIVNEARSGVERRGSAVLGPERQAGNAEGSIENERRWIDGVLEGIVQIEEELAKVAKQMLLVKEVSLEMKEENLGLRQKVWEIEKQGYGKERLFEDQRRLSLQNLIKDKEDQLQASQDLLEVSSHDN